MNEDYDDDEEGRDPRFCSGWWILPSLALPILGAVILVLWWRMR